MSTLRKIWLGIVVLLGLATGVLISIMMVNAIGATFTVFASPSITKLLGVIGLIGVIGGSGLWHAEDWRFLRMTFPQIQQESRAGRGPLTGRKRAEWQRPLLWAGLALLVLSQWRAWSGLQ